MSRPADRRGVRLQADERGDRLRREPADRHHRDRIEREFGRNLLVEAGAGSGKTHSLARRMAAGIAAGAYEIERMAAVTFTRKAAAELRGRFQLALEERLRRLRLEADPSGGAGADDDRSVRLQADRAAEVVRLEHALANLERFYAGTIHAFCAHLLRERPVESGVAPGFRELDEEQDNRAREEAWRDYIAQARGSAKPELLELLDAGMKAQDLDAAFRIVCLYEEVDFPPGDARRPDLEAVHRSAMTFWTSLQPLLPKRADGAAKCKVLEKAEEFRRKLRVLDPQRPALLVQCLELWQGSSLKVTQKWWDRRGDALAAQDLFEAFRDQAVLPFLTAWRRYLYRLCVTVLVEAREHAARERRRHNTLNYGDLLQAAARVLREKPLVRRALQRKYRWLFVDEFQDTDPVQAEIIVLLAADERSAFGLRQSAVDWASARLRPGALFVVGDPKQSIYRFRRADIDIYSRVKRQILDSGGEVVPLTANFRSVESLCEWANGVFVRTFPPEATRHAPAFERLDSFRGPAPDGGPARAGSGLRRLTVAGDVEERQVPAAEADAIARYIRGEVDQGRRSFGDFLILTRKKKPLAVYARALERYRIPLEVSGAGAFGSSEEVEHLAVLLRALGDPQNAVALVGALRGPFFGISDPELFEYVRSGGRLWLFDRRGVPDEGGVRLQADQSSADRVAAALASLRQMHRWTRLLPPAAAVDRILDATGYLALAATTPSGAAAGDLLHAIDRIRQVARDGGTLLDAVQSLEEDEEASGEIDALPLEPGRTDVVRVMNLHKAKGLEAPVVFLADPCGGFNPRVDVRIVRNGSAAEGYFRLESKSRKKESWGARPLAEPAGWDEHGAAEKRYLDAEGDRLLYVAATRARDLLVIGRWANTGGRAVRAWAAFDPWLRDVEELEVPLRADLPPERPVDLSAAARAAAAASREAALQAAVAPSWAVTSVTAEARHVAKIVRKAEGGADDPTRTVTQDTPTHRADAGMAWGTLIHGLLEHAMRHQGATVADLRRLGMWLTMEQPELRSVLDRAVALVQEVSKAGFWKEAQASPERHEEVPFATAATARQLLFGAIDLVFRGDGRWQILDYKTDVDVSRQDLGYLNQLRRYLEAWQTVSGSDTTADLFPVRLDD